MERIPFICCLMAASCSVLLIGCEKPQDTLQALRHEVSAYAARPTDEVAVEIDERFTSLDAQIARLRDTGKNAEADDLANQRDTLQAQYLAARMTASLLKAKEAAAGIGEAFRKAGEAFGKALQSAPGDNN